MESTLFLSEYTGITLNVEEPYSLVKLTFTSVVLKKCENINLFSFKHLQDTLKNLKEVTYKYEMSPEL